MYTSYIGNIFLKLYRQKKNVAEDYTARQFYDDVLFPLLFDNERHLMHVHGSSFFQKVPQRYLIAGKTKSQVQLERLHRDIENAKISGSTYVGYAAEKADATSSGQVTSMPLTVESEEMYMSWIGQALAIGVSGGLAIQIDRAEVLWRVFEGWLFYRKYLDQTPKLKDKQIETWNGHWLCHLSSPNYDERDVWAGFDLRPEMVLGKLAIPTIDWIKVVFALTRKYPDHVLTTYVYNLSQTNTTLGFINLYLPEVSRMIRLKEHLYTFAGDSRSDKNFEEMYRTFFTFKHACMLGTIGLKALEPAKLRDFMPKGSVKYARGNEYRFTRIDFKPKKNEDRQVFEDRLDKAKMKSRKEIISYKIFKIWIVAMLNKTQLLKLASETADVLLDLESKDERGKKVFSQKSQDVRDSKHLRAFIQNLTEILPHIKEKVDVLKDIVEEVLRMPTDNFPLFITLIRFEYNYQKFKR